MRWASSVAITLAALVTASVAQGHGGSRSQGYVSTFSTLEPSVLGVFVNVFGPQNQVRLSNYSRKTVVVLGYWGEPYLRFAGASVEENLASPTAYLNSSRPVPSSAVPGAKERWHRVARSPSFTWHDHRIVWTGAAPPAVVRDAPKEPHVVFRWRLPATADGKPFRIAGFLGWSPPRTQSADGTDWGLVGGIAAGAAAAVVALAAVAGMVRARRLR